MQPLLVLGASLAISALVVVMVGGPAAPTLVPLALGIAAVALLGAGLLRRTVLILRSGDALLIAVGALALAFAGVVCAVTVGIGGVRFAVWLWTMLVGAALLVHMLQRWRSFGIARATPWQVLGGGAGTEAQRRGALTALAGILLGGTLLLAGLGIMVNWLLGFALGVVGGSPLALLLIAVAGVGGVAVVALAGVVVWLLSAARVTDRHPADPSRGAATAQTQRDEQVVAAHLHDSVLQTLALIGRNANDPAQVAQLARQQERSLRAWLAGRDAPSADSLAGALRLAAQEVEDEQPGARIEVVVVGDAPLDRGADAMVRAAREAMRNAVRHAGSPVRVFLEVDGAVRELFVRDTGSGFDPDGVPEERRGVRDAIVGRMEHVGGTATIDTGSTGTEIALRYAAPGDREGKA